MASEVIALRRAAKRILASPRPEYFRIFADPADALVMENSNFPKLLSIAKALKVEAEANTAQFVTNDLDTEAYISHTRWLRSSSPWFR